MADQFSNEQIDQLKTAFEPMFRTIYDEFRKWDAEREKDRAEFRQFQDKMNQFQTEMTEFREETNGHFASLEKRFHIQQESIDEHDQQLGTLRQKPA